MKKLIASMFAAVLLTVGLIGAAGGTSANAASCGGSYPACPTPTPTPTPTPSHTPSANPAVVSAIQIAGGKGQSTFTITLPGGVQPKGGIVQIRLHKKGTPGSKKVKITIPTYNGTITKKLPKGTWHGTIVYLPATGTPYTYAGNVFYDLKVS